MESNSPLKPEAGRPAEVLTVDEAAALLRVNRKSLYQAISLGKVPGVIKVGRVIRLSRVALESWMQNGAS